MPKVKKNLLIIGLGVLALAYLFCLPAELFHEPVSATLESSDGTLLGARISSSSQWYFEPCGEVPVKFAKCIMTYEDGRFPVHGGVDLLSAARAFGQFVTRGEVVSGASTITMQVIRLSRPDAPRNVPEKILEMIMATRLELRCSKRTILKMYASHAPFGGNVIGLEAAAWRWFGRPADDLSWAECATLAVLPNSPALIHPGRNRSQLLRKRNFLLDKLMEKGILDATECELAKDEPLPDKPLAMPDRCHHLLETARLSKGDGIIHSTIDASLQERVNSIARSAFRVYHTNLVDNIGILVADVRTGRILAYYGNTRDCDPSIRGGDVDMIPAPRSSGSTLKPILYAAMLQSGQILPGSLVKDTPYNHRNFSPHNFNHGYDGAVPANEVIQRSLNVPSVRMLERYTPEAFLDMLRSLGFSTIDKDADHYGLSLILGGAEITLGDLVGAYCRMAAKLAGDPVHRSLNWDADAAPDVIPASSVPLSKAAIWLTFEALSGIGRPEEEASWMDYSSGRRIAWKTGTSWGSRDAWSVGMTRDYVVGVWVGNSDGEGRAGMTGVSYAAPVMFDVFSCLKESSWFERPEDGLTRIAVCHKSGLPASDLCPERDTVWVPDIEERPGQCGYHRIVHLDEDGLWQVNSNCCPVDRMQTVVRFVLPPAQEWYYMKRHPEYIPLPPKHPLFDASSSSPNPIAIIYPQEGITIVPTRGLDGQVRGAVFTAAHTDPQEVLYWHLDDEYLGETRGEHEMLVAPSPGEHRLLVLDGSGARRSVTFFAK